MRPNDVDRCLQTIPENNVQGTSGSVRECGDDFLVRKMTGDESWLKHFQLKMKRQSMEWYHINSLYSPDLASCDYHIFSKLQQPIRSAFPLKLETKSDGNFTKERKKINEHVSQSPIAHSKQCGA